MRELGWQDMNARLGYLQGRGLEVVIWQSLDDLLERVEVVDPREVKVCCRLNKVYFCNFFIGPSSSV